MFNRKKKPAEAQAAPGTFTVLVNLFTGTKQLQSTGGARFSRKGTIASHWIILHVMMIDDLYYIVMFSYIHL